MTLLHKAFKAKKFDVRLLEKNVSRGILAVEDIEQDLSQLPDDAENADYTSIDSLANEGDSEVCASEQISGQTHH